MTIEDWRWIFAGAVVLEVLAFIWLGYKMRGEG